MCQRPLSQGIDLVVHSLTKNLGGFGTDMGGAVIGPRLLEPDLLLYRKDFGAPLAPRSAWPILVYGLPSLAIRVRKQQETALKVARFLERHPRISRVWYPGLRSHPQHALARLLNRFGIDRQEVRDWPMEAPGNRREARTRLISETMRPAATTESWRDIGEAGISKDALEGVLRIDCAGPREEADTIALLMRAALEDEDNKTAALVTPDRDLARPVPKEVVHSVVEAVHHFDAQGSWRIVLNQLLSKAHHHPANLLFLHPEVAWVDQRLEE